MTNTRVADPRPVLRRFWMLSFGFAFLALMASAVSSRAEENIIKSHGYSFFGDLTYPADFPHFSYVNPDAPKGGEIALSAPGTFDSMNPYSRKGRGGRYSWMMYESLLGDMPASSGAAPADVVGESYGLLAESLEYDEGKTWVIFNMRREARFSDGSPVTAHDVVFTHNLFLEQGLPSYAQAVSERVLSAEALDDHTVKFTFALGISRRSLIDQVGNTPVFARKWFDEIGARLDEPRLETAPGSGPYMVDHIEVNRQIIYRRNPDYWGWHLPINKGRHNFDTIRIEYFADDAAAFEGFKGGEYTFRTEGASKKWATGYDFPAVNKGDVALETLADGSPPVPTGFVFNLNSEVFKDRRVREAISLAYNFEWSNASLQYGLFAPRSSFVQGSRLQAMDVPASKELALLQSLGDLVPAEMLSEPAVSLHTSDENRVNDRRNLRRAKKLLDAAGWAVDDKGMRHDTNGKPLLIDFPVSSANSTTLVAIIENFVNTLKILGVDVKFEKVDPSQYTLRNREKQYDMVFDSYGSFEEAGTGLMQMYGSERATISVFNPAALASPLVDKIIDVALKSTSLEAQDVALTALDRALRYERMMIPLWFKNNYWVASWDMFEHPEVLPANALGVLDFWWFNAEKADALKASGALR